jgi:hypothetical protein
MGPAFPDLYARVRDSVKRRVARWPSAYASAQLVREYKALVAARHGARARPYTDSREARPRDSRDARHQDSRQGLTRWFREKWVDVLTREPCGSVKSASYYPTCRPLRVALRMTPAQVADAVARKQLARSATVLTRAAPRRLPRSRPPARRAGDGSRGAP